MKFERLGWIVAALLAGGIVGVGFDGPTEKLGSVDLARVFNESDVATKQTEVLHNMGSVRLSVLEFLQANIHMKADDAKKFRDLSLKEDATAAEKLDLERVKTGAQTNESNFNALQTKPNPAPTELAQVEELTKRKDVNTQLLENWNHDFSQEIEAKRQALHTATMKQVREAVAQVAKKQGYTMVFSQECAAYAANDITTDALNQMNGGKK